MRFLLFLSLFFFSIGQGVCSKASTALVLYDPEFANRFSPHKGQDLSQLTLSNESLEYLRRLDQVQRDCTRGQWVRSSWMFDNRVVYFEQDLCVVYNCYKDFWFQQAKAEFLSERAHDRRVGSTDRVSFRRFLRNAIIQTRELCVFDGYVKRLYQKKGLPYFPQRLLFLDLNKKTYLGEVGFNHSRDTAGWLEKFTFVSPQFRGKGLGTKFMRVSRLFLIHATGRQVLTVDSDFDEEEEAFRPIPDIISSAEQLFAGKELAVVKGGFGLVSIHNIPSILSNLRAGFLPVGPSLQESFEHGCGDITFRYPASFVPELDAVFTKFRQYLKASRRRHRHLVGWELDPDQEDSARLYIQKDRHEAGMVRIFTGQYGDISQAYLQDPRQGDLVKNGPDSVGNSLLRFSSSLSAGVQVKVEKAESKTQVT